MNFVFFRLPNIPESGFFFRLRRAKPSLKYCNSPRFIFKNTPKKIGASRLISNSSNLKMTISNSNALKIELISCPRLLQNWNQIFGNSFLWPCNGLGTTQKWLLVITNNTKFIGNEFWKVYRRYSGGPNFDFGLSVSHGQNHYSQTAPNQDVQHPKMYPNVFLGINYVS